MSLANFLAEKYGAGMVMESLKATYPPAIVLIDALGERALPDALDRWADAHMKFVASQPLTVELPWCKYRHRFLTESPARGPLLDLIKDLGLADVFGIDVDQFVTALTEYKGQAS
jgi:hypothetical protein